MTDLNRTAGIVEVVANGLVIKAAGSISYNLGLPIRESLPGHDSIHGYKEMPQAAYIEGEARMVAGFSIKSFVGITNATVTATLATGKIIMISDAWFEGEGTGSSEEGTMPFKFCSSLPGEEIG